MITTQLNMLVYDCEIIRIPSEKKLNGNVHFKLDDGFERCAGWRDFKNMGISVIGAYDYVEDRYRVFCSDNFSAFQELVKTRRIIAGFNNIAFDNRLCEVNGIIVPDEKSYDLLMEVWRAKGLEDEYDPEQSEKYLGVGLDALAKINLSLGKTGHGSKAPALWQGGSIGSVVDYCLMDVTLTKRLIDLVVSGKTLLDSHPETRGNLLTLNSPKR